MSLSSVSVSKSKQLIYPSSEMHPSLEPNLLLLGNGLIVDELKSMVRGKIKQLKSDLVERLVEAPKRESCSPTLKICQKTHLDRKWNIQNDIFETKIPGQRSSR